jgi:hypothetical protein
LCNDEFEEISLWILSIFTGLSYCFSAWLMSAREELEQHGNAKLHPSEIVTEVVHPVREGRVTHWVGKTRAKVAG